MLNFSTPKISENADLIWPFIACFFGEPVKKCPFRICYELKDEIKQIKSIETFTQNELDEMRSFHEKCMSKLIHTREFTFPECYLKDTLSIPMVNE